MDQTAVLTQSHSHSLICTLQACMVARRDKRWDKSFVCCYMKHWTCVCVRVCALTWPAVSLHQHTAPAAPWAPLTRPCTAPRRWSLGLSDRWRCGGWCCVGAIWGWGAAAAGRLEPYLQTIETIEHIHKSSTVRREQMLFLLIHK